LLEPINNIDYHYTNRIVAISTKEGGNKLNYIDIDAGPYSNKIHYTTTLYGDEIKEICILSDADKK